MIRTDIKGEPQKTCGLCLKEFSTKKEEFTWQKWFLEMLKGVPMFAGVLYIWFTTNLKYGLVSFVFALMIASIMDKQWQERVDCT